ncbi:MAG: molybdopterin converting factor subunit 1 [Pseudohongiellaceae bacterium]
MLRIQYFANVREQMGVEGQEMPLSSSIRTVADLMTALESEEPKFAAVVVGTKSLLVAVNQTVVEKSYVLSDDDEVAFFPPMTGG